MDTARKPKSKSSDRTVSRPSNAWILYRSACIARLRETDPAQLQDLSQADLSKSIALKWREEPPETKAYYSQQAEQRKSMHVGSPVYRRPPRRSASSRLKTTQPKTDSTAPVLSSPSPSLSSQSSPSYSATSSAFASLLPTYAPPSASSTSSVASHDLDSSRSATGASSFYPSEAHPMYSQYHDSSQYYDTKNNCYHSHMPSSGIVDFLAHSAFTSQTMVEPPSSYRQQPPSASVRSENPPGGYPSLDNNSVHVQSHVEWDPAFENSPMPPVQLKDNFPMPCPSNMNIDVPPEYNPLPQNHPSVYPHSAPGAYQSSAYGPVNMLPHTSFAREHSSQYAHIDESRRSF